MKLELNRSYRDRMGRIWLIAAKARTSEGRLGVDLYLAECRVLFDRGRPAPESRQWLGSDGRWCLGGGKPAECLCDLVEPVRV